MLYVNRDLDIVKRKFSGETVKGVVIGKDKDDKEVFISVPDDFGDTLVSKHHISLSIIEDEDVGYPQIVRSDDEDYYVILSSRDTEDAHHRGRIKSPIAQKDRVIARGQNGENDFEGDRRWPIIAAKMEENDIFRIA